MLHSKNNRPMITGMIDKEQKMKSFRRKDNKKHDYVIRYLTHDVVGQTNQVQINQTLMELDDILPDYLVGSSEKDYPIEIVSVNIDGESDINECDGGGATGGDAGGTAGGDAGSAPAGDSGDVAGEMNGITTAEVLGTNKPGQGFFGKDNFYIPSKVKFPFHRWEICNGGSKRKKTKSGKPKKYPYEKGMKVVVDMFEDEQLLNEWGAWPLEKLKNKSWDDFANIKPKNRPSYDRWEAAQLPPPEEAIHDDLGGCEIVQDVDRKYLKEYYIHGHYADGTLFKMGPMRKEVAREYINLYGLSMNAKAYDQLEKTGFSSIQTINDDGKHHFYDIVKFKDGFYLKAVDSAMRIGPFSSKPLARTYAMKNGVEFLPSGKSDRVDKVDHLYYPTFAFSYKMAGIDCMDIVVAETLEAAMKLFDLQWKIYDNSRPTKDRFNSIEDLNRDLSVLRIKDIDIEELDGTNVDDYVELAEITGNPSTIPHLKARCRNPRFKYILGRDKKTGRSPVKIRW